jgi:hypothetical protein
MIPRAHTAMALLPAGRAIAKSWMSAARTSDQGLRPRMIDHFNEPASRATRGGRSLPFAPIRYRRNSPGVGSPFVLRRIEGRKKDHGATAATAGDTKCVQHQTL